MSEIKKPTRLMLELTRRCNANCIMCTRSSVKMVPDMEVATAKKYIDEAYEMGVREFDPRWFGEITCYDHDKLMTVCDYIVGKSGSKILLYTNGSKFSAILAEYFIRIRKHVLKIVFSIDECEKERYERIRKGLIFEEVIENLVWFNTLNKRAKENKIDLIVRCTELKENKERIPVIKKFFESMCETFASSPEVPRKQNPDRVSASKKYMCGWNVLGVMCISADGRIALCCTDWHLENPIGFAETGLKSVWYGERHKRMIANRDKIEMCINCR